MPKKDKDNNQGGSNRGGRTSPASGRNHSTNSHLASDQRVCQTCDGDGCKACSWRGYVDLRTL